MQKMTVKPGDVIIVTGDVDIYEAQQMIVNASKEFPDNTVVFIPEGTTLSSMGKKCALEFLDTMKKFVEEEVED